MSLKMSLKKRQDTILGHVSLRAGLITSGSLDSVLQGKEYTGVMTCHKATLESLERLLLMEFLVIN